MLVLERVWRFESSSGHHSIFDLSQIKYLDEKQQHSVLLQNAGEDVAVFRFAEVQRRFSSQNTHDAYEAAFVTLDKKLAVFACGIALYCWC